MVLLAAQLCQAPTALLSFVDGEQVWVKAQVGSDSAAVNRSIALFAQTHCDSQGLIVEDLWSHPQLAELKALGSGHRFLAVVPLSSADGLRLGTLSVLDVKPRRLLPSELRGLQALARQSMAQAEQVKSLREQQRRAENLFERKMIFRSLIENLQEIIFQTDRAGRWTYLSPAWFDVLGHSPVESLGRGFADFIHPEDLVPTTEQFQRLLNGDQEDFRSQLRYRASDHSYKWIEVYARATADASGVSIGTSGILRDIHAKWISEDRLRQEKEKLETIVNNIPLFLSIYDEQGHMEWANPAFEQSLGWTIQEGQEIDLFTQYYPDPAKRQEVINFMRNPRRNDWMTFDTHTKDGRVIPTSWMNVRLSNGRCIGIGQDISTQRRQEKLIREQQAKIVAAAKMSSLGEMAGGVAHEINNPLTIILGKTQILKQLALLGELRPQDITDACAKIDATVGRIAKIISGLKSFARDGSLDPFEKANLGHILRETLSFCEERFRNNRVPLTVKPFDENLELDCRSVQISQVLLNLLNNAFDAVVKDPDPWVQLEVKYDQHFLEITVEDSGSGIPGPIREKIMQPFFTTKESGKGTGLGLSLSQALIESHQGTLDLDSSAKNTRFRIRVPKQQRS